MQTYSTFYVINACCELENTSIRHSLETSENLGFQMSGSKEGYKYMMSIVKSRMLRSMACDEYCGEKFSNRKEKRYLIELV